MSKDTVLTPFPKPTHNHHKCVAGALASAEAQCEAQGLRLTDIRRRVLALVWQGHAPMKAYDILGQLQIENPRTAPPTVYRAIEFLIDAGLVHRIESLNAYVGCGKPDAGHRGQFLICNGCGVVAEMDDPRVSRLLDQEAAELNFKVERQTVEIRGLCPQCS
jgi:Fur family zinc uptake transcriptional regulator